LEYASLDQEGFEPVEVRSPIVGADEPLDFGAVGDKAAHRARTGAIATAARHFGSLSGNMSSFLTDRRLCDIYNMYYLF
jgi:hypothetical protein